MTAPPHLVRCPYCLDPIAYDSKALLLPNKLGGLDPVDPEREPNPIRREDLLRNAFQRCPNRSDLPPHNVPVPYLRFGQPLTVAMVGASQSGKTHLLYAMLADLQRDVLTPFGLSVRAVNSRERERVVLRQMQKLDAGKMLSSTPNAGDLVTFLDALLIEGGGRTTPVGFFDVSGEDLTSTDRALRFLAGVDALIFVVDAVTALQLPELARVPAGQGGSLGDRTFAAVLDRLPRSGALIETPAAMVVAKSDLLRFRSPVDRWLGEELRPPLDPALMEAESRDAFALLHEYGGAPWLKPFLQCRRCTLHFASATGGDAQGRDRYPRGAHSRRAVQPLLSILAMRGLLGPYLAEAVGR